MSSCRVVVGESWVVTTLPSGVEVHAHPSGSVEQLATARELGYGDDVAAMTRDHDPLHVALAAWLGMPCSESLREASGAVDVDRDLAGLEERAVLAVQALARRLGVDVVSLVGRVATRACAPGARRRAGRGRRRQPRLA